MIYGGRGAPDLVLLREMEAMRLALFLTTEDGAVGDKGLVTRALEARLAQHRGKSLRVMGCGPNGMLWAIARLAREQNIPCFISLEEQMACGIGVCLGCAIPARSRPYRYVCSNGPVFDAADVLDVASGDKPAIDPPACLA
jgi:dihydroorotate dehydrogenase electron transfer subunit